MSDGSRPARRLPDNITAGNPSNGASRITEKDLTSYVRDIAKLYGWRRYHTWISKHSAAGFPDEILLRDDRLIVAELKSQVGKVTSAQNEWLKAWRRIPCAEVFTWTPADMDVIAEVLR
jgi:hypothetical protein